MSKANNPIKVLRTAFKRVSEGWTQHVWVYYDSVLKKAFVCLEGGVFGYCDAGKNNTTPAQRMAIKVLEEIIFERYGFRNIPAFNDEPGRTQEEVLEVIKLAIIRLETMGDHDDIELTDEELEEFDEVVKDSEGSFNGFCRDS